MKMTQKIKEFHLECDELYLSKQLILTAMKKKYKIISHILNKEQFGMMKALKRLVDHQTPLQENPTKI